MKKLGIAICIALLAVAVVGCAVYGGAYPGGVGIGIYP